MPTSVLSRGRSLVARLTALAMVASIMVIGALPASAAVDTSDACPASISSTGPFTDILGLPAAQQTAINCIADYGITVGTSSNTFSPGNTVPRWQMALFLTRQAEEHGLTLSDGTTGPFTDISAYPAATQVAINQLVDLGITVGTSATTFSPGVNVPRWQMALFLTRLLDEAGFVLGSGADQGFTDIGAFPASAQTAINQLAQADVADGTSTTTFSPGDSTNRAQMALFLTRVLQVGGVTPDGSTIGLNATFTAAPELVSAEKGTAGVVRYNFDTTIPGQAALDANFRLYAIDGTYVNPTDLSISGQTVLARFTPAQVSAAIRAGVRTGAVETGTGIPSIAGSYPLTVSATQPSGLTNPLLTVGNYQFNNVVVGGDTFVLVDFVFDGNATALTAIDAETAYTLYGANGEAFPGIVAAGTPIVDYDSDADTTTVTVAFGLDVNDVPESQLRRGAHDAVAGTGDVLRVANYEATGGITVDPDLVSITKSSDTVFVFEFDEAVDDDTLNELLFWMTTSGGGTFAATAVDRIADAEANKVRAEFATGAVIVVYGWVENAAVEATDSLDSDFLGQNRPDASAVTLPTLSDPTPGNTDLPDLVSAERLQDVVTGRWSIELTFDEAVTLVGSDIEVALYDAAGVEFAVVNGGGGITDGASTIVITSDNSGLSDDEIEATVTVSVQDGTVGDNPPDVTEGQTDARQVVVS